MSAADGGNASDMSMQFHIAIGVLHATTAVEGGRLSIGVIRKRRHKYVFIDACFSVTMHAWIVGVYRRVSIDMHVRLFVCM